MDWNKIANNDNLLSEEDKLDLANLNKKANMFNELEEKNKKIIEEIEQSKAYTPSNINSLSEKIPELNGISTQDELYLQEIIRLVNSNKIYYYLIMVDEISGKFVIPNELINKEKHINYVFNFNKNPEITNLILLTLSKKFEGKFLYELISNKKYHNIIIDKFNELNKEYKINLR